MSYQSERFSSLMQAAAALVANGKYTVKAAVTAALAIEREIDNRRLSYTNSNAFAARGTILQYSVNPPFVACTELLEIKKIGFGGTKYDLADVTKMNSSNFREWLPTLADSGDLTFEGNLIPNDLRALVCFFNNATLVTWEVVLPADANQGFNTTLGTFTFLAYVAGIDRTLPVDKEASISGKLKITGKISFTTGS